MTKIVISFVTGWIIFCHIFCLAESSKHPPNFLLILTDDQRADTISYLGNPHIQTPSLDKLCQEGTSFLNNYCGGSYSGAVCVASRAMLLTGKHWHRIKDRNNWKEITTLPSVLQAGGYQTHIVGKWHNGEETLRNSFQTGSAVFLGGMADHTAVPVVDMTKDGHFMNKRVMKDFSSTGFANSAIEFLQRENVEKPFFLYVAFTAPHDPRNPPEAYREYYYENRPPLPFNFLPQHPFNLGPIMKKGRDEGLAPWPRPPAMISDQLCEYYGLISHLDNEVGRILDYLDSSDLSENTLVIYTSDHGLALGSHGLMGKQNLYEHSMRSPLIIRGKGIQEGLRLESLSYLLDLYPTICDYAGIDIPATVDGSSLVPLLNGSADEVRGTLWLAFQNNSRTIRDERYKLHIFPEINHEILFDLVLDPLEQFDLSKDPAYTTINKRLKASMIDWQKEVGDTTALLSDSPDSLHIDLTGNPRTLDVWQPEWIRNKYFNGRADPNHGPQKH